MPMFRCKAIVEEVAEYVQPAPNHVVLVISDDPTIPTDQRFTMAGRKPQGTISFETDMPEALAALRPGKQFYVYLVPV